MYLDKTVMRMSNTSCSVYGENVMGWKSNMRIETLFLNRYTILED